MRVIVTRDPEKFADRARGFLEARIERNVLATVLGDILEGRYRDSPPLFAYATDVKGGIAAAALRTPPWYLLAVGFDPESAGALIDRWLAEEPDLPGVTGTPESNRAIAQAWTDRTGGSTRTVRRMAVHQLGEVRDPPRLAPGSLRRPAADERGLMIEWMQEFARDAEVVGARTESMVDGRMTDGLLHVWDHNGPVSLVGLNHAVAGVVRIGPVFTPREYRRRGYAGTAVAAASRMAVAGGARTCILSTDLANPTSNKVYAEVGYARVVDWEELALVMPMTSFGDPSGRESPSPGHT
jgi:RimJ/RimL family protein N-acetyltransferase